MKLTKEQIVLCVATIMLVVSLIIGINSITIIRSRPIKFGMENMSELVTQAGYYTNVQVVEKSRDVFGIEVPFTESKYIFSYDGVIKAGIDFQDVEITVDEIKCVINVKLPEAKIISNELNEESFEIYDERKNIFTPLKLDDMNSSLIAIEEESEETAIKNGILDNARKNAETLIAAFISSEFDMNMYTLEFV